MAGSTAKEPIWACFYGPDGKLLLAYTLKETFPGEMKETMSLLAYEKGIEEDSISVRLEARKPKAEAEPG